MATAISTVIGLVMGALAGFYGGIWDTIIMRCADIFLAFPYVLFVVAMIAVIVVFRTSLSLSAFSAGLRLRASSDPRS